MYRDNATSRRTTRSQSSFSSIAIVEERKQGCKGKSSSTVRNTAAVDKVYGLNKLPQTSSARNTRSQQQKSQLPVESNNEEHPTPMFKTGNMAAYLALRDAQRKGKDIAKPVMPQPELQNDEDSIATTVAESKKRKGRGKTRMDSIHARKEKLKIPLNDKFQPVSTDRKLIAQFSLFLGTIGRDYVDLNHVSWPKVPNKESLWAYVKAKYDIDERAHKWVMKGIRDGWKMKKARIKEKHYTPFETDEERIANRPNDVEINVFMDCLVYWNDPDVQAQAKRNSMNRRKNVNPHTAGSTSFAQINHEWKTKNDGRDPSKADTYIGTHKREEGKKYKSDSHGINCKISTLENLRASGATSETVEQVLLAGEAIHGPNWLVGRNGVTKEVKSGKTNSSEMPSTMLTVEELVAKVQVNVEDTMKQKMNENLVMIVNQIANDNPGLKVDLDAINNLVNCGNAAPTDVCSREVGDKSG